MKKSKKDELKILSGAEVIGYIRIPEFCKYNEGDKMGGFEQRFILFRNPDLILSITPEWGESEQLYFNNKSTYHSVKLESPKDISDNLQKLRRDPSYRDSPKFRDHYEKYLEKILSFYNLEKE